MINGTTPFVHTLSSVGVFDLITGGTVEPSRASVHTNPVATLNPAELGTTVAVCAGDIYADTVPPLWCRYAAAQQTVECVDGPWCAAAGAVAIDSVGIYGWSADGTELIAHVAPDPAPAAIAASAAAVALVILESAVAGSAAPRWLITDAAWYAGSAGVAAGCDPREAVVYGVAITAAWCAPQRQAADAAAAAVSIALGTGLPVWVLGQGPAALIELVVALTAAAVAGRRGGLWVLPWAAAVTERMVLASAAVGVRRYGHVSATAWLIVISAATIGLATIRTGRPSWWTYFGVMAAADRTSE